MNKKVKLMYLEPAFSNQKSFYGKARMIVADDSTILTSYAVKIVELKNNKLKMICKQRDLSATTLKHLREFLRQFGFGNIAELTKKEMVNTLYN